MDFDADPRLRSGITGDMRSLFSALDDTKPEGGTALYDSILFSLLQFERQPGRRGLVVITDGMDTQSLTDPGRTVEFGQKLGVPIYIIALTPRGLSRSGRSLLSSPSHALHILTDPTGGRLYHPPNQDLVLRALAQIKNELRSQYVLTYYTEVPATRELPEIKVRVARKGARVKATWGVDQID